MRSRTNDNRGPDYNAWDDDDPLKRLAAAALGGEETVIDGEKTCPRLDEVTLASGVVWSSKNSASENHQGFEVFCAPWLIWPLGQQLTNTFVEIYMKLNADRSDAGFGRHAVSVLIGAVALAIAVSAIAGIGFLTLRYWNILHIPETHAGNFFLLFLQGFFSIILVLCLGMVGILFVTLILALRRLGERVLTRFFPPTHK